MAKLIQRKKPGHTKSGEVKIVSLNTKELVDMLDKTSKKKTQAKIRNKLAKLKYVAPEPVVAEPVDTPAEEVVQ